MRQWVKQLDRILRGEATGVSALRGGQIEIPVGGLVVLIIIMGVLYGACMGCFSLVRLWNGPEASDAVEQIIAATGKAPDRADGLRQVVSSAAKVPALFLLTLLVTFPSLYVFNALVGSRLMLVSVLRLLVAALSVMVTVLFSFGTIVVFFSFTTKSYPFMLLLNVVMYAVSGLLGLIFLLQTLNRLSMAQAIELSAQLLPEEPAPAAGELPPPVPVATPQRPGALDRLQNQPQLSHVKLVFRIWLVVFSLVGAQMGWVLRPFIWNPNTPFAWFRERGGNFFEAVGQAIHQLIAG